MPPTAIAIEATGLVWDGRVLCSRCPAGLGGASRGGVRNAHPHVTLATAPGVSTAESNALLRRLQAGGNAATIATLDFIEPLLLRGELRRFAPGEE